MIQHPEIIGVTSTSHIPTQITNRTTVNDWDGREDDRTLPIYNAAVNYDFIEMLDIEIVEGRAFSKDFTTDAGRGILLNEAARQQLGWTSATDKHLDLKDKGNRVIGVVKDIHFHSFHEAIAPLALYLDPTRVDNLLIKIRPQDIPATIRFLEDTIHGFSSNMPFEYYFLNDTFTRMYLAEQKLGQIFGYFTALALIIACLGVFGLTAYTTGQRAREIGIRKAMGASWMNIVWLLSKEVNRLVLIAFVIGAPIAYYAMRQWLQDFAYRIELGVGMFALAGLLSLLIACITVSYHSIKAARTNPVETLRYE